MNIFEIHRRAQDAVARARALDAEPVRPLRAPRPLPAGPVITPTRRIDWLRVWVWTFALALGLAINGWGGYSIWQWLKGISQ